MSPPDRMQAKTTSKGKTQSSGSHQMTAATPQEATLKCPGCDSLHTKFCYYYNQNLLVGSGHVHEDCRKNKKLKSSLRDSQHCYNGLSNTGRLNLPASDFHYCPSILHLRTLSTTSGSKEKSPTVPCFNLHPLSGNSPFMGFNFPFSSVFKRGEGTPDFSNGIQKKGSFLNLHSDLAASIESLISINQYIHLKLHQQRLATMGLSNRVFTHRNFDRISSGTKSWASAAESSVTSANHEHHIQRQKSISFQNLNSSESKAFRNSSQTKSWTSATGSSALSTNLEHRIQKPQPSLAKVWCFDNCYLPAIASNSDGRKDQDRL